uniref:ribosomal protein L6 n=1 Tax=Dictyotopsis propagulifera TaxID=670095 RepID=UPI002E79F45B|nr:ribosomal protein L6 [Dictyotopsis propagulifera]WBP69940.1 ribosomal protein L6 [Dictyotopsis propagulifera]
MSLVIFRLPLNVKCFFSSGKIYITGPQGVVLLNINNNFVTKSGILIFNKSLSHTENLLVKQALLGVSTSYTTELKLNGIGYRVEKNKNKLLIKLGYSHLIKCIIPNDVIVKCLKNKIHLRSANLFMLKMFSSKIRKFRFPNQYKGNGILYENEVIIKKEIKKN